MQAHPKTVEKLSKGERTALRIMDVAEELFSQRGYDGVSLRQIATGAGIREPGLYNHFSSKAALYEAVLSRALNPMAEAISRQLAQASGLRDYTDLPSLMTDMLLAHPNMAALLQQALQGTADSVGNHFISRWLEDLIAQGLSSIEPMGPAGDSDPQTLAINVIALFNVTIAYFLSQRAFDAIGGGDLNSPDNIARQKDLLHKVIRAMLIS